MICPSASASIGLSGSQSGHTYQLQRNGTNTGSPVNGTGSALTFQATQTGTYTVVATNPAGGGCTALMSGSAVLTNDNTPPTITCAGPVTLNTTAGQCTGTTTLALPSTSDNCLIGNALSFDGNDDVVRVADNSLLDLNFPLTLEAWFYPTGSSFANIIVDKRTADDNNLGYGIWLNNAKPAFYLDNNGNTTGGHVIHVSPNAVSTNAWHHMAVVYDGASVKIYVDGVLTYDQPETSPITPTSERLSIGDRNQGGQAFAGRLEEVRIWNVARTLSEIQTNMNVELNAQSGLVAVYHFNEGAAGNPNGTVTTAPDASGNNLNGALNNFLLSGSTSNWTSGYLNSTPRLTNNAPATYPYGSTVVTWTATDFSGNTATCEQIVTVNDDDAPTFTCPTPPSLLLNTTGGGNCLVQIPDLVALVTDAADNCALKTIDPVTQSIAAGNYDGVSDGMSIPVTVTVTDNATPANSATCVVTFMVNDNQPPAISCPTGIVVANVANTCFSAPVTYTTPVGTDNCTPSTQQIAGLASGVVYPLGITTNTFEVSDGVNPNSSCSFTVEVTDTNGLPINNTDQNEGYCNLADAVSGASTTSTQRLTLQAGTYTGCVTIDRDLHLAASGGTVMLDCLILDGAGKTLTLDNHLTINNLTLTGGRIRTNGFNLTLGVVTGGSPAAYIVTD